MLSRVAESLYWMSRYLERAEHTARLLDMNLNLCLDRTPASNEGRWRRMVALLHGPKLPDTPIDMYAITQALTFDPSNAASIVTCINAARENARQVREQCSSEMWEQLNQLFLDIKGTSIERIWEQEPWAFFRSVKDGSHLFQGITDSTMSHGQGWEFIEIGRSLERAGAVAALVDNHYSAFAERDPSWNEYLEWVGLLKGCTAFEAYCKVHTAELRPERIAEFLLLNAEFPHSVRYSVDKVKASLDAVAAVTDGRKAARVNRLAGRLTAALSYGQIDEIVEGGLHAYLDDIRRQFDQLHTAIQQTYIAYSIESALVA